MPTNLIQDGDVYVVQIEGELNHLAADALRAQIESAQGRDVCDFVVNMADCTGIDSAGLEALTWLQQQCQERLGMCKVCMISDAIRTVLIITRLDKQLDVCETVDDALAELKTA